MLVVRIYPLVPNSRPLATDKQGIDEASTRVGVGAEGVEFFELVDDEEEVLKFGG